MVRDLAFPIASIVDILSATERRTSYERPLLRILDLMNSRLGPILEEVLEEIPNPRLEAVGSMGLLPIMATTIGSTAVGAVASYQHPRSFHGVSEASSKDIDLLVVDLSLGEDAARVRNGYLRACSVLGKASVIVEMRSDEFDGTKKEEIKDALARSTNAMFFGHGRSDLAMAGESGLVIGNNLVLSSEEISVLNLSNCETLTLVACASGRQNPYVGPISSAHAAALAGASQVVSTLWPIRAQVGSRFASDLLQSVENGGSLEEFVSQGFVSDARASSPFCIMR